jgi:hypothetical protein
MKTRIIKEISFPLIGILISINALMAQSIPNAGFETWTIQQQIDVATGWVKAPTVSKSSDAHSGQFAAEIIAGDFTNPQSGQTFSLPGRLVTGAATTGMGQTAIEGFSFSQRPDSLTGWFKYSFTQTDACIFNVTLTKWNPTTQMRDIIGEGQSIENEAFIYRRFSFPVSYISNEIPDTCIVEFLSSDIQSGIQGSILLIDDIEFVYNNVGINESEKIESMFVYPNPVAENGVFKLQNGTEIKTVELLNSSGILLSQNIFNGESCTIEEFPAGTYFLKVNGTGNTAYIPLVKL